MSARSLANGTNAPQADSALKTSLLNHAGIKQVKTEPKPQSEAWIQKNLNQKSRFKQDFSCIPVGGSSAPVIQPKLVMGQSDDRYEQEADRVAEQVMRMPDPATVSSKSRFGLAQPLPIQRLKADTSKKLQRQVEESEEGGEEETVQAKRLPSVAIEPLNLLREERIQRQVDGSQEAQEDEDEDDDEERESVQAKFLSPLPIRTLKTSSEAQLQRQADELQEAQPDEEEEPVQAKGMPQRTPKVTSELASRLKASQGGGQPLPDSIREFMESRFNYDFSQVRVHTDGQANELARSLNAQAFTFKQDIYFGSGFYQPHTASGKRLLAHELTHTIQQQDTPTVPHHQDSALSISQPTDGLEREAEAVAHQVGKDTSVTSVVVSEGVPAAQSLISLRQSGNQSTVTTLKSSLKQTSSKRTNQAIGSDVETVPEVEQDTEEDTESTKKAEAAKSDGTAAKTETEAEAEAEKPDETAAETAPPETAQQAPASPAEDPAFQETLKQIGKTKRTQSKHAPPDKKLGEVKKAAVLPEKEQKDKNDRKQHLETIAKTAETVDKKKEPFKPETFKQLLNQNLNKIESHLPQDEASARQFKQDKPLEQVKEGIGQQVAAENQKVAAPITTQVQQATPKSGLPTQAAQTLKEAPVGPKPPPIDPQAATPKPKHDSEISMDEESQKLDAKLSEHNMTEEQLENSGDEEKFKNTLSTKRQAQQEAKAAPQRYRQEEEKILAGAEKKAQSAGKRQFAGMAGERKNSFDTVFSKQVATEKADTDKQKEVFKGLEAIYNETKENVNTILTWLSQEVDRIFTEESDKAKKEFEDTVEEKLDDIHGLGIVEFFAGEDTEAIEQVFREEKEKFLSKMDKTLDKIANLIAEWLNNAIGWIEHGRTESEKLFNGLDKDQQEKSRDAFELFNSQYDDLEASVNEKQDELAQTLAESYKSNVDSLRETFNKINEEVKKSWIDKAIEFIEEVASAIAKLADLLQSVLQRVASLIGDILAHPIRFLENLAAGVKAGFDKFISGIQGYLVGGFFDWLRGSIGGAGITIPDKLDAAGIFSLVMQVLGLSYDTFRGLAVKILGKEEVELVEKGAGAAEKGLEIFQLIRGKGVIALWDNLKEMIVNSFDGVMNQVKETVLFETVKKALAFIGSLFTPAGAFIKAVQLLYKGLRFLVDNIDRISELVNAFMDSIELAVRGNSAGIASRIIKALQNFIVLAIDFLAKLLGLGDLAQKVRKILQAIRKPIIAAIEWLLKKVKPIVQRVFKKVKGLIKKGKTLVKKAKKKAKVLVKKAKKKVKAFTKKIKKKGKAVAKKAKEKLLQWWKIKKRVTFKNGETHTFFFKGAGKSAKLFMRTSEMSFEARIAQIKDQKQKGELETAYQQSIVNPINQKAGMKLDAKEQEKFQTQIASALVVIGKKLGDKDEMPPTAVTYTSNAGRPGRVIAKPLTQKAGNTQKQPTGSRSIIKGEGLIEKWIQKTGEKWPQSTALGVHILADHLHGPWTNWNIVFGDKSLNENMTVGPEKQAKANRDSELEYDMTVSYFNDVNNDVLVSGVDKPSVENLEKALGYYVAKSIQAKVTKKEGDSQSVLYDNSIKGGFPPVLGKPIKSISESIVDLLKGAKETEEITSQNGVIYVKTSFSSYEVIAKGINKNNGEVRIKLLELIGSGTLTKSGKYYYIKKVL